MEKKKNIFKNIYIKRNEKCSHLDKTHPVCLKVCSCIYYTHLKFYNFPKKRDRPTLRADRLDGGGSTMFRFFS